MRIGGLVVVLCACGGGGGGVTTWQGDLIGEASDSYCGNAIWTEDWKVQFDVTGDLAAGLQQNGGLPDIAPGTWVGDERVRVQSSDTAFCTAYNEQRDAVVGVEVQMDGMVIRGDSMLIPHHYRTASGDTYIDVDTVMLEPILEIRDDYVYGMWSALSASGNNAAGTFAFRPKTDDTADGGADEGDADPAAPDATPQGPPSTPANLRTFDTVRPETVGLEWDPVDFGGNPGWYNLYFAGTPGVDVATAPSVDDIFRTSREQEVALGATLYFRVTAENASGESSPSNEVSATAE